MTTPDERERADALASTAWPTTDQLPTNSGVRLIFAGLMGFCCRPSGICEVGFYTRDRKHRPQVTVYEKPGCDPDPRPIGSGRMKVGITNQATNVLFYRTGQDPFNRYTGNHWDTRWMIDLGEWYPSHQIKPGYFAPVLEVTHGTFFTLQKSNSTFRRVQTAGTPSPEPFGYLIRYLAADIQVATGQTVTLDTGSGPLKVLYPAPQRTYEVLFTNLCPPSPSSDFDLLVEAFANPGDPIYNFYLDSHGNEAAPHFCTAGVDLAELKAASDDAPCMPGGFGGAGGFPGP